MRWRWLEPAVPSLDTQGAYTNWATDLPRPEPNNLRPPEDCGSSNLTQQMGGVGGWSDANCGVVMPFMCMLIRECPGPLCICSCVCAAAGAAGEVLQWCTHLFVYVGLAS